MSTKIKVDDAELATILAALRFYQKKSLGNPDNRSIEIHDIATNCGTVVSLDSVGIDALCAKVGVPTLRKYNVIGQVFLADGFNVHFYATSREDAERKAREWASNAERDWEEELHEVCIENVTEVE